MRRALILLISSVIVISACKREIKCKKEIKPYVNFLNSDQKDAKDYILDLFEENDLVIICEREHRENTQYKFLKDLISDPRFIKNVGNLFTEVGMRSLNPELNQFLHAENIPDSIRNTKIIDFQRYGSYHAIWEKYNFYDMVNGIYEINQDIKESEKINFYPTDVVLNYDSLSVDYLKRFWNNKVVYRDRLMADYIIENFESIKASDSNRKKALVIMNFRHSFNNNFKDAKGRGFDNVGRYLFDEYDGKIANVLINPLGFADRKSDVDILWAPLQDGRWDAAFIASDKNNIGFDFKESPFGNDRFDFWSFTPHNYKYQDIFTGFVYYETPENFQIITGVDGLVDNSFLKEYKERVDVWTKAVGNIFEYETNDSLIFEKYNKKNRYKKEGIDSISLQINSWLIK
jgi:hypothetical protein